MRLLQANGVDRHFSSLIALPRRRKLATSYLWRLCWYAATTSSGIASSGIIVTAMVRCRHAQPCWACPQSGGATEYAAQSASKIFLSAVRRTKSPCTGDARCMGYVGHLLFELTLALAARCARGSVCS